MTVHQNHTRGFREAFPDSLKAFRCCEETQTTKAAADSDQASPQLSLPVPLKFYESRLLGSITLFLHLYNKFPTDFSCSTGATCCNPPPPNVIALTELQSLLLLTTRCWVSPLCRGGTLCPNCISLGDVVCLTFTSVVSGTPQRRRSHSNDHA